MSAQDCVEIMGMPVAVEIVDRRASRGDVEAVFEYLRHVDDRFSTFKPGSETERLNRGEVRIDECSEEMREVLSLCERTRVESGGYFDARYAGPVDPAGVVKGWAVHKAAELLRRRGLTRFVVEAGGDMQTCGTNRHGRKWKVGIRDPFRPDLLANVVYLSGQGIATSGTYERGRHIFDPLHKCPATGIASVSVIAADVCEADRFATAAFAMGEEAVIFLERRPGLEGLMVCLNGDVYCTTGFPDYMRQ